MDCILALSVCVCCSAHFTVQSVEKDIIMAHILTVTNRFRLLPSMWCRRFSHSRSSHLIFGRPLGLVPVTFILSVLLVMWVSSLRITCPYHDNRFCPDRSDRRHFCNSSDGLIFNSVFPVLSLISIFILVIYKRCSSCLRSAQH